MSNPTYSPLPPPPPSPEITATGPMLPTLHDWFLGQALQGALIPVGAQGPRLQLDLAPAYAIQAADAMMVARLQAGPQPDYMTRRDWLAGMALPGLAAFTGGSPVGIADVAYQLADEAMEEQKKGREAVGY